MRELPEEKNRDEPGQKCSTAYMYTQMGGT